MLFPWQLTSYTKIGKPSLPWQAHAILLPSCENLITKQPFFAVGNARQREFGRRHSWPGIRDQDDSVLCFGTLKLEINISSVDAKNHRYIQFLLVFIFLWKSFYTVCCYLCYNKRQCTKMPRVSWTYIQSYTKKTESCITCDPLQVSILTQGT